MLRIPFVFLNEAGDAAVWAAVAPGCPITFSVRAPSCTLNHMHQPNRGFTLLELLVTLVIMAVLVALAAPNLRNLILRQSVDSAAALLVSDFRYARSEALKRSRVVVVCASGTGTSCAAPGAALKNGWMVFVPSSGSAFTAGDTILRVQPSLSSVDSIGPASGSARISFVFQATGWSLSANESLFIKPTGSTDASLVRLVCVSKNGRAALRARGETTCA